MKQFFKNIKTGIYNFWFFRKVIWNFRWWDYTFNLEVFSKSLELTAIRTETIGNHEARQNNANQIKDVIALMNKVRTGDFIEQAEKEIGYELADWTIENGKIVNGKGHDDEKQMKVFDLSHKLEQENWELIWKKLNDEMQGWWD